MRRVSGTPWALLALLLVLAGLYGFGGWDRRVPRIVFAARAVSSGDEDPGAGPGDAECAVEADAAGSAGDDGSMSGMAAHGGLHGDAHWFVAPPLFSQYCESSE